MEEKIVKRRPARKKVRITLSLDPDSPVVRKLRTIDQNKRSLFLDYLLEGAMSRPITDVRLLSLIERSPRAKAVFMEDWEQGDGRD
jgi:hypothetical protein